jgi:DNA-binding transcriptional MerR regulator
LTSNHEPAVYSIGAVARMLDIPASTLRAWEDRYAIVTPVRSEGSQRLYSRKQVEQLRYLKAQIESGASAADAHRLLAEQLGGGAVPAVRGFRPEGKPLVLIAGLDAYAADLADCFLRTEGYEVAVAFDAAQAKLQFDEQAPDVVVVDLLISGGSGFRLVGEFAETGTAKVLAVAAIDAEGEAMRAGAAAFLRKPLEALQLVSAVRELLGAGAPTRAGRKQHAEL